MTRKERMVTEAKSAVTLRMSLSDDLAVDEQAIISPVNVGQHSAVAVMAFLLGIGLAIGVPAAMALGKYVSSQLYGIEPQDPGIAIVTMLLLALVSAAAGLIPAHRASRINPILALRYE